MRWGAHRTAQDSQSNELYLGGRAKLFKSAFAAVAAGKPAAAAFADAATRGGAAAPIHYPPLPHYRFCTNAPFRSSLTTVRSIPWLALASGGAQRVCSRVFSLESTYCNRVESNRARSFDCNSVHAPCTITRLQRLFRQQRQGRGLENTPAQDCHLITTPNIIIQNGLVRKRGEPGSLAPSIKQQLQHSGAYAFSS